MIPQWVRDHGASITVGAYVGYFVFGGMMRENTEVSIFTVVIIALVVGSLWAINRMES